MTDTSQPSDQILVADDDPSILRLVSAILQKEGYSVIPARDGQQAFQILYGVPNIRAAIFDVMMPHVTGPELVRHMKSEKRLMKIPVMIMTTEQDPKLASESFHSGAVVFCRSRSGPANCK